MNRTVNKKAIWIILGVIIFTLLSWLVGILEPEGNLITGLFTVAVAVMITGIVTLIICGIYLFFNWMFPKKGKTK